MRTYRMVPLQNNLILVRHLVLLQETAIAPQSKQGSLLHLHTFLPQLTDLGQTSLSGYYRKQELVITTKFVCTQTGCFRPQFAEN